MNPLSALHDKDAELSRRFAVALALAILQMNPDRQTREELVCRGPWEFEMHLRKFAPQAELHQADQRRVFRIIRYAAKHPHVMLTPEFAESL